MATHIQDTVSSGPSIWLRIISWIFKLSGSMFAVFAIFALGAPMAGVPTEPDSPPLVLVVFGLAVMAAALILTGILLARRQRSGAWLALFLSLYPLAFVLAGQRPLVWSDVVVTVVTIAVIASIWPQLSPRRASVPAQ